MKNTINKESLKTRLTYLFRIISELTYSLNEELAPDELQEFIGIVLTYGIKVVHTYRVDNEINQSERFFKEAAILVRDRFQRLLEEVHSEAASGLPITLTVGKCELAIITTINDLADKLIELYEGPKLIINK